MHDRPNEHGPSDAGAPAMRRHGCLAAWLVVSLVAASISLLFCAAAAVVFSTGGDLVDIAPPEGAESVWALGGIVWGTIAFLWLVSLIGVIGIFRWKYWGFYVYCLAAAGLAINALVNNQDPVSMIWGPLSMLLMFFALKMGGESNGWERLE